MIILVVLSISIGIIGIVAVVCAVYKFIEKKIETDKKLVTEKEINVENLNLDYIKENKRIYDKVSGEDLEEWFYKSIENLDTDVYMVIAIPTREIMDMLGYQEKLSNDIVENKNYLIQWINDIKNGTILKASLVKFNSIGNILQATLASNQGMIVYSN